MAAGILQNNNWLLLIFFLLPLMGCTSQSTTSLYAWGPYQSILYQLLQEEGTDPQTQILKMEEYRQRAVSMNRNLPPGYHAQLGLLYAQLGNLERMRTEFLLEKEFFPEAAEFIDYLLSNKE